MMDVPLLSIVTPAFNEAKNVPVLYQRMREVLSTVPDLQFEWVVVDDHSSDDTFEVVLALRAADPRVRVFRLAHNSGSHAAIVCGLHQAKGEAVVVLAADLQDPPEVVLDMLWKWRNGAQVVWAARRAHAGQSKLDLFLARTFYFIMRRMAGLRQMPSKGADFFLVDRNVVDNLVRFGERNVSVLALITWMGFRQDTVEYDKQERLHGTSGWTLRKKLKFVLDSITSFSYFPIWFMSCTGMAVALTGLAYALLVIFNYFRGTAPTGWSSLMVIVLTLVGFQMLMTGVLGEYVWRGLDEARRRPQFIIEATGEEPERRR